MKKICAILIMTVLLTGCSSEETLETVCDEWLQPVMATPRHISVQLPEEVAAPVMESETEQIYVSDHYELILETCASGDLNATVNHLSGYEKDRLTILQTGLDGCERYAFVWAAAGEQGERLGRAVILDDGQYHYCLSVLQDADSETVGAIDWNAVFGSFRLA